jgi:hypothetical protein
MASIGLSQAIRMCIILMPCSPSMQARIHASIHATKPCIKIQTQNNNNNSNTQTTATPQTHDELLLELELELELLLEDDELLLLDDELDELLLDDDELLLDDDELDELLLDDDELLPPRMSVSMHVCHAHVCTIALDHLCTYDMCAFLCLACMCDVSRSVSCVCAARVYVRYV